LSLISDKTTIHVVWLFIATCITIYIQGNKLLQTQNRKYRIYA